MTQIPLTDESGYPLDSTAIRLLIRNLLIEQFSLPASTARYPGVERALDRAAQALLEAALIASGSWSPAALSEDTPRNGDHHAR